MIQVSLVALETLPAGCDALAVACGPQLIQKGVLAGLLGLFVFG
jgi:hypothetical protein